MKRMTRKIFEDALSRLPKGVSWNLQTLTVHGQTGGCVQLHRNAADGLIYCDGSRPTPVNLDNPDADIWPYLTEVRNLWPRGKTPSFCNINITKN